MRVVLRALLAKDVHPVKVPAAARNAGPPAPGPGRSTRTPLGLDG